MGKQGCIPQLGNTKCHERVGVSRNERGVFNRAVFSTLGNFYSRNSSRSAPDGTRLEAVVRLASVRGDPQSGPAAA